MKIKEKKIYDLIHKLTWITNEGKNMLVGNLSNV